MTTPLARILYVEDDADVRKVATFALKMVGKFTVEACASGEEALSKAELFAPQLLLLDVISKPFDPMTLSATVRGIWERREDA